MVKKLEQKQYQKFEFFWKTEFRDLVNLNLLLNRKELASVFYMKKLHLVDIFSTVYHLNHFDRRFVRILQNTGAATRRSPHDF